MAVLDAPARMLAEDLALALDPVQLARRTGLEPDPWQADLLRSNAREVILLASRQSGKTTAVAILALHEALFGPPAPILVLSPSLRQSKELFRKIKEAYAALGRTAAELETETSLELEFASGARIVCLPGQEATIRGFSGVRLLLVDEAARVPDALYQAIRPMLAISGGRIVLLSTPFGKRGFFHHEWTEGGPSWKRVRITAADCPRISPEWLAEERSKIGEWWYSQEYQCEFVETLDQVFSYDDVRQALDPSIQPFGWAILSAANA